MRREICWPERPNTGSVSMSKGRRIASSACHRLGAYPQHLARPLRVGFRAAHKQAAGAVVRAARCPPTSARPLRFCAAWRRTSYSTGQCRPGPRAIACVHVSYLPPRPMRGMERHDPDRGQVFTRNPLAPVSARRPDPGGRDRPARFSPRLSRSGWAGCAAGAGRRWQQQPGARSPA